MRIGPEVTAVTSGGSKVTGVETSEGSIEAGTVVVEAGVQNQRSTGCPRS